MKVSTVTKDQWLKIFKAAAYIGISAVISYLITLLADQPELFGPLTPIVNIVLVTLKQVFTESK